MHSRTQDTVGLGFFSLTVDVRLEEAPMPWLCGFQTELSSEGRHASKKVLWVYSFELRSKPFGVRISLRVRLDYCMFGIKRGIGFRLLW